MLCSTPKPPRENPNHVSLNSHHHHPRRATFRRDEPGPQFRHRRGATRIPRRRPCNRRRHGHRRRIFQRYSPAGPLHIASHSRMAIRRPESGRRPLLYLASKIWRGAAHPLAFDAAQAAATNVRKSFWIGLSTQLSNPKTAVYYGSIFAALLAAHPPLWCYFALPPAIFAGWYTVVALCFSSKRPRRSGSSEVESLIDRVAAGAVAALGLRLILTAHKVGI